MKAFWIGALWRGFIVLGITFFSMAISTGFCYKNLETSLIAGGLYLFLELAKHYKVDLPTIPKGKKGKTKFLLFP